eukprot:153627-Chlamydomonas_euryale.AAC.3
MHCSDSGSAPRSSNLGASCAGPHGRRHPRMLYGQVQASCSRSLNCPWADAGEWRQSCAGSQARPSAQPFTPRETKRAHPRDPPHPKALFSLPHQHPRPCPSPTLPLHTPHNRTLTTTGHIAFGFPSLPSLCISESNMLLPMPPLSRRRIETFDVLRRLAADKSWPSAGGALIAPADTAPLSHAASDGALATAAGAATGTATSEAAPGATAGALIALLSLLSSFSPPAGSDATEPLPTSPASVAPPPADASASVFALEPAAGGGGVCGAGGGALLASEMSHTGTFVFASDTHVSNLLAVLALGHPHRRHTECARERENERLVDAQRARRHATDRVDAHVACLEVEVELATARPAGRGRG